MRFFALCACFFSIIFASEINNINDSHKNTQLQVKPNDKDVSIMIASLKASNGEFNEAATIYLDLFKKTNNYYFLKRASIMYMSNNDVENAFKYAMQYQEDSKNVDDIDTNRIISQVYVMQKKYNLAAMITEKISTKEDNTYNNYLLGNLYYKMHKTNLALKNYKIFYESKSDKDYAQERTIALGYIIQIYQNEKNLNEAIKYANDYIKNERKNTSVSAFYVLYKNGKKLKEFEKILLNRFKKFNDNASALDILYLYLESKEYQMALDFINNNKNVFGSSYHEALLQVYVGSNNFNKALNLSQKIYKDTNMPQYLGLSAVYRYELLHKKNKANLEPIIMDLKKSIQSINEELKNNNGNINTDYAFFYNFLGYLLIDHDIDVKEGMKYVSVAVSAAPNNFEYLDSLAWGFYKLGECKKANETFDLIPKNVIKTLKELRDHKAMIDACKK